MATEHILKAGYYFGDEFEFGLNMILKALNRSIPDHDKVEAALRSGVRSIRSAFDPD